LICDLPITDLYCRWLYGSETWTIRKNDNDSHQSFQMQPCCMQPCNHTRWDSHKKHVQINCYLWIQSILVWISKGIMTIGLVYTDSSLIKYTWRPDG